MKNFARDMNNHICPECGKKFINVRDYKDGTKFYVHALVANKYGYGFNEMEGCYWSPANKNDVAKTPCNRSSRH